MEWRAWTAGGGRQVGAASVDGRWGWRAWTAGGGGPPVPPGPCTEQVWTQAGLLLSFCTWEATSPTQSSCWEDEMPRCGGDVGGRAEKVLSRTRGPKSVGWAVGNR